jgi:hypothetical protein
MKTLIGIVFVAFGFWIIASNGLDPVGVFITLAGMALIAIVRKQSN